MNKTIPEQFMQIMLFLSPSVTGPGKNQVQICAKMGMQAVKYRQKTGSHLSLEGHAFGIGVKNDFFFS